MLSFISVQHLMTEINGIASFDDYDLVLDNQSICMLIHISWINLVRHCISTPQTYKPTNQFEHVFFGIFYNYTVGSIG